MNIFVLHPNPRKAARWHCDSHVVKMLLELCQLLYTAHWALAVPSTAATFSAIELSRHQKTLKIPDSLLTAPDGGYRPVHIHHPCALWTRRTLGNYNWLCCLAWELANEFRHRFGHEHSCEAHVIWLKNNPPSNIRVWPKSSWAVAMDTEYKINKNPVSCYRHFYKVSKGRRGLLKYTGRQKPHWLIENE
ncbi:MAG: hypothetical protein EBT86_00440 [Actinobacteria bacterium]|nr:hypothetical protein [Actinomycetota bacterium]